MKTRILSLMLILVNCICFSQDSLRKINFDSVNVHYFEPTKNTHILGFSPMSRKIEKINGFVFGVGHIDNKYVEKQTINGLNLEINPAPAVGALMTFIAITYLPEVIEKNIGKNRAIKVRDTLNRNVNYLIIENSDKTPLLKLNGINISSGCFFTTTDMNGLNISLANKFKNFNGISIAPLGTISDNQIGVSLGLVNANNDLNGFVIGIYNQSYKLDGLQVGIVNMAGTNHGLQVGLVNNSRSKGFQVGLWNKNAKRSFPFINW